MPEYYGRQSSCKELKESRVPMQMATEGWTVVVAFLLLGKPYDILRKEIFYFLMFQTVFSNRSLHAATQFHHVQSTRQSSQ